MNACERDPRKRRIAARFGRHAGQYEAHADMQRRAAAKLAGLLPTMRAPRVLEIGCGTGLFTRHLLAAYPDGAFTITDIAPPMLAACAANIGRRDGLRFMPLDGDAIPPGDGFDLIASSMALQWFDDPEASLRRLRGALAPGGRLIYAATGPQLFPEWRDTLAALGLPCGLPDLPAFPGVVEETSDTVRFAGGLDFLAALRATGAAEPRTGYRSLTPGELRRALRRFEAQSGGRVTWHIVYGRLAPDDQ